jgi:hypothetical protein
MMKALLTLALFAAFNASAQTNRPSLTAAFAVPGVQHIVGKTDGTFDAFTAAQLASRPAWALPSAPCSSNCAAPQTAVALSGTTGNIGGSQLLAAGCTSGNVTINGATVGMTTTATPTTYPGNGAQWQSYVSAPNTVTVVVCALAILTPVATTYNVRVIQ